MRLAKALKLKIGTIILCGDHKLSQHCTHWWKGKVLHVTERGGIKVRVVDAKPWFGPAEYSRRYGDDEIRWVPYTHVYD